MSNKTMPSPHSIYRISTTFPNPKTAEEITQRLLKERLIACSHLSSPVTSTYIWKEKLCTEKEYPVSYKCSDLVLEALMQKLQDLHPYEVPEILMVECQTSPSYAEWVFKSCQS